ncbi:MAG: DUF7107 domain-containing protein, partial [Nannocystaceae bacterium]
VCEADQDCPQEEICIEGQCTDDFIQCQSNEDCPPMSLCIDGFCG